MLPYNSDIKRWNELVEAFDRVTGFQFDRVTDPDLIVRLARALYGSRPASNLALAAERLGYNITMRLDCLAA